MNKYLILIFLNLTNCTWFEEKPVNCYNPKWCIDAGRLTIRCRDKAYTHHGIDLSGCEGKYAVIESATNVSECK